MKKSVYHVLGLMSGTSLDGLDMAYCKFQYKDAKWDFKILGTMHHSYSEQWEDRLQSAHLLSAIDLLTLDKSFGGYLGKICRETMDTQDWQPDFISSHGHTVFHQPEKGISLQIGDGLSLSCAANLSVISDFRSKDVCLGGQGAPLVPIGDQLLFGDYDVCVNLGGIANLSFEQGSERIAYDICPVNMPLNYLASKLGLKYDPEGIYASKGEVSIAFLETLNELAYYQQTFPKSLGREWFEQYFLPEINCIPLPIENKLASICEHIAIQIAHSCRGVNKQRVLFTGGGAKNDYLISRIRANLQAQVIIPPSNLVDYKEAIVFAFLGVLKERNEVNCLSSVTGASRDNCGGVVHQVEEFISVYQ